MNEDHNEVGVNATSSAPSSSSSSELLPNVSNLQDWPPDDGLGSTSHFDASRESEPTEVIVIDEEERDDEGALMGEGFRSGGDVDMME